MKKSQSNKTIYFELSSKPNVDISGITVSMWENMCLKQYSLLMMPLTFKMKLSRYFGLYKYNTLWY